MNAFAHSYPCLTFEYTLKCSKFKFIALPWWPIVCASEEFWRFGYLYSRPYGPTISKDADDGDAVAGVWKRNTKQLPSTQLKSSVPFLTLRFTNKRQRIDVSILWESRENSGVYSFTLNSIRQWRTGLNKGMALSELPSWFASVDNLGV